MNFTGEMQITRRGSRFLGCFTKITLITQMTCIIGGDMQIPSAEKALCVIHVIFVRHPSNLFLIRQSGPQILYLCNQVHLNTS